LPPDIPAAPERVYHEDWKNWADWLGHSRRIGGWRNFKEARKYARSLKLRSHKEWTVLTSDRTRANAHKLPDDIPSYPNNVYEEWIGWWDWLGTSNRRGRWQSYSSARTFARKLELKSEAEFIRWRRGLLKHKIKCPIDMPMHPDRVYSEFVSWPDFLDFTPVSFLPFDRAREFVRRKNYKTSLSTESGLRAAYLDAGCYLNQTVSRLIQINFMLTNGEALTILLEHQSAEGRIIYGDRLNRHGDMFAR
jgi:hypothetical protein